MAHYRFHIDIPFDPSDSEEECVRKSQKVVSFLETMTKIENLKIDKINYRLGHDEDRQKSNYLDKNENGHVSNKKFSIVFKDDNRESERIITDNA